MTKLQTTLLHVFHKIILLFVINKAVTLKLECCSENYTFAPEYKSNATVPDILILFTFTPRSLTK